MYTCERLFKFKFNRYIVSPSQLHPLSLTLARRALNSLGDVGGTGAWGSMRGAQFFNSVPRLRSPSARVRVLIRV